MATLYRKYRPQNFEEVVGQNHIKLTLKHEIETGKIAHAYMFCGPRAVGKTTLARIMAKAVNCQSRIEGQAEPCDKCDSCHDITSGRNIDVIEIDAASNTGVDNVRENIIASARVAPSRAKYKVFIIDEVHMLSISSFNALLKIIEEPPVNVIFILCTTEIHKVPTTIISRCQRFDFKKIGVNDIVKKLNYIIKEEKIEIKKEIIEAIARRSQGYMRDAESLLGQIVSVANEIDSQGRLQITDEEASLVIPRSDINEVINLIIFLEKKDAAGGISLLNKLINEGVDLKIFITDFIELTRKIMLNKISPALNDRYGLDLGEILERKVAKVTLDLPLERLVNFIERFSRALQELRNYFIIQLPVELAIVDLCQSAIVVNSSVEQPAVVKKVAAVIDEGAVDAVLFSWDEIKQKWDEVLIRIKKYNHSLSFILKVCEPKQIENNLIHLAFKYKFHKDRVSEPQIKTMIEKTLAEVYGMPLSFVAVIDENLEIGDSQASIASVEAVEDKSDEPGKPGENLMNNLLKNFGGRIVN